MSDAQVPIDELRAAAGSLAAALRRQKELGLRGVTPESADAIAAAMETLRNPGEVEPTPRPKAVPKVDRTKSPSAASNDPASPVAASSSAAPTSSPVTESDKPPPWARDTSSADPIPTDLPPAEGLKALREHIGDCTRCRLCENRTNIVFGVGNPAARLMFVGEAPGYHEDQQAEPFVGKAGQLLTKMIGAMGLRREDVYIANIIKCRPPENRDPKPDEIAMCEPFLVKQIQIIEPEVVVTLGRYAAQTLLRTTTGITRLRGTWTEYESVPLMPTLHPAYLLRNPAAKRDAWNDLQMVMKRLGLEPPSRT